MSFTTNILWQNDPRWADSPLGNGPETFRQWGCLDTSLAMVLNGCGYNETPLSLSQKMVAIGAFNGASINPYRLGEAFPCVSLARTVDCGRDGVPLADIDAALAGSKPVIVCVDSSPADGVQDHWVVLYAKSGSDYLMLDPWDYSGDAPGKPELLTQRYHFTGSTPDKVITQVMFLNITGKGDPAGTPTPAPVPSPSPAVPKALPSDSVALTAATDGLAFRGGPAVTAPLLRRFALGAALQSLEPKDATLQKVGVQDQWINVQAPEGDQGYVAAWFVTAAGSAATPVSAPSTTPVAPPPSAPGSGVTVIVTQDQLAFRSQPVIADATLIARFPLNTRLTAIDPQAAQKIGVVNQWLQVQDASGRQGYVAAWYVAALDSPTSPASAPTPATSNVTTVKVIEDQLAFRSQPVIADNTLIARLPLGTLLTVTDPQAAQKIGVVNQWLQVKDAAGRQGYVAAWYVSA